MRTFLLSLLLACLASAAPLPLRWKEPLPLDPATIKIGDKAWVAYARGQVRRAVAIGVHQLLPGGPEKGWAWEEDDGYGLLWVRMEDFKAYRTEQEAVLEARRLAMRRYDRYEEDVPVRRGGDGK